MVQLRMLLSNTQQLALMSMEISSQQTWKIVRLCWEEGAEHAKCSLRFLGSRETRLGEGDGGGGTRHNTTRHSHSMSASVTKPIRLCWQLTEVLLLAGR